MEPPKNVQVFENSGSTYWIDEDGIVCSISKKVPPPPVEVSLKELEQFRKQFGDEKHCFLMDITNASPTPKEAREFAANELPKLVKAMAMVSRSALGRMVANLFFGLKPPPYPAKMFENEEEARKWLKQYLQ